MRPTLHAVTDDAILARPRFVEVARDVMRCGGPRLALHLRTTAPDVRRLWQLASALAEVQHETGAWVVINGRADLAIAVGARGVQLGRRAPLVADIVRVRATLAARGVPAAAALGIGASVHAAEEGDAAARAGADWLMAGHIFVTGSHPAEAARGVAFLERVVAAATCPVIAIGGITPRTVGVVRRAGASGVAAIRGLWEQPDAPAAVAEYLSAYDDADRDIDPTHGQR
ncbi:MAG: thiamine phosphate synthase [Gemmatimonadaceae bacterium]|nr:thiamine phosphate synthase [Gemmatimonadaceae bacterium]